MEEKDINSNQYLVPANVNAKFEFFSGFGFEELGIVAIALIISIILSALLGIPKKTEYIDPASLENTIMTEEIKTNKEGMIEKKVPVISPVIRIFIGVFIVGLAFFAVKRDPSSNMSVLYTLKSLKEFNRKQKLYMYKYNSGGEV